MKKFGEKVEDDMEYCSEFDTIRHPRDCISMVNKEVKRIYQARHKTDNKRLEVFHSLHNTWGHDIKKHKYAFKAIVTLI